MRVESCINQCETGKYVASHCCSPLYLFIYLFFWKSAHSLVPTSSFSLFYFFFLYIFMLHDKILIYVSFFFFLTKNLHRLIIWNPGPQIWVCLQLFFFSFLWNYGLKGIKFKGDMFFSYFFYLLSLHGYKTVSRSSLHNSGWIGWMDGFGNDF